MSAGKRLALAAEGFLGVPFRLHGRDPATGLDCVGLVSASLEAIGRETNTPRGYRLRNASIMQWASMAADNGLLAVDSEVTAGDLLLVVPGPAQHHLLIAVTDSCVVHAHAGLGRVVIQPRPSQLQPLAHWRLLDPDKEI
jgi:cell wall-associated NlpC family hydrolase